jgi:hypothetical protein
MSRLRNFAIGVSLGSAVTLTSIVQSAANNYPTVLAQMTPGVCWDACSASCEQAYKSCTTKAQLDPDQLTRCDSSLDRCHDQCRNKCGLKK